MKYSKNLGQQGFSMIEVMIALVIGMVLLGGAVNIFISNNNVYRLESELSRMQETGRFIIDIISQDVRMAGYNGCASRDTIEVNVIADSPPPQDMTSADNAVLGFNNNGGGTWTPTKDATVTGGILDDDSLSAVLNNSDILTINRADSCGASVADDNGAATLKVTAPNDCGFVQNEPLLITNCSTAELFQTSNTPNNNSPTATLTHATNINTGNFFDKKYSADGQVFKMRNATYFIANGESGEPALWQSIWKSDGDTTLEPPASGAGVNTDFLTSELADGVESMQLFFGEDTGGNVDADVYVKADAVTTWADVRSVRINFLLRSNDNITTQARAFAFNGANANTTNDLRLRMAFSTTVTLRNRLP